MRQALAGMLWSKQFYHYDRQKMARRRPGHSAPPPKQRLDGRNHDGCISITTTSFRCPTNGNIRGMRRGIWLFTVSRSRWLIRNLPKTSSILLLREWYMHPNGQIPAYEWAFGDVNPPVHAWAALRVYQIEAKRTRQGRPRIFGKNFSQTASEFYVVGQPQRRGRQQRF